MNIITKSLTEGLTSTPLPLVRSYAGGKLIVTINLDIKQSTSARQVDAPTMDGEKTEAYQCTTISVLADTLLSANDVVKIIVRQGMFASIDTAFLKRLVESYTIPDYDTLAAVLVSGKYTYAEELAAHRKALLGDKQSLEELSAYVEQCKQLASACFKEHNHIPEA